MASLAAFYSSTSRRAMLCKAVFKPAMHLDARKQQVNLVLKDNSHQKNKHFNTLKGKHVGRCLTSVYFLDVIR